MIATVLRHAAAVALFAIGCAPAHADRQFESCEARLMRQAHTDMQLGSCGAAWVHRAEQRLAIAWRAALVRAGGSQTEEGHALLEAQRAWIVFKDKACLSYEGPTAGTLARFHDANICLAGIVEDRVSELNDPTRGKGLS